MDTHKKKWHELSGGQRVAVIVAIVAQLSLQGVALADLRRRPESEIRGKKSWWFTASFVNFFGPIAYLVLGRR